MDDPLQFAFEILEHLVNITLDVPEVTLAEYMFICPMGID